MTQGYLALVLHAHLPYIRHPEYDDFLEEDWLFEAMSETYLPLLEMLERLEEESIPCAITMSLTPPLCGMLRDPLLQRRFALRLDRHLELADKEAKRTKDDPEESEVVDFYRKRFAFQKEQFERYDRDLIGTFARFQTLGMLEICTCGATHGFLPLMALYPEAVRAQIQIAVHDYEAIFQRPPRGIWLPECGYYPGLETILQEAGLRYFFVDTHGIQQASPPPVYGVHAPLYTPAGVAAFGRDPESSRQVWSSKEGYPGDFDYREFYRDIGYDLPLEVIRPYIQPTGDRKMTGFKYYRITGPTDQKKFYKPAWAAAKAKLHAADFLAKREAQISLLASRMQQPPVVLAPYDAELFGHWWFEGPLFLEALVRVIHEKASPVRLTTPPAFLEAYPRQQIATPPFCSWGADGYAQVWLDPTNDWLYPHLHTATSRLIALASAYPEADGILRRALNQMTREVLLAQSSDWAFIMKTGTSVQYAIRRSRDHLLRAQKLYEQIRQNVFNLAWLEDIETRDSIFPSIDYRIYAARSASKRNAEGSAVIGAGPEASEKSVGKA